MADLKVLETDLNTQSSATKFTANSDITKFAKDHFKSTRYTTGTYASHTGKALAAVTAFSGGLAYFSIGQKNKVIANLYEKIAPKKLAYVLLASSVILVALVAIWDYTQSKNTNNLRDALESNDPETIINAYKKSGMPPALLLKEAAQIGSKVGMTLALHIIEEKKRKETAQTAHFFGKETAQDYLTESFELEHCYLSKNMPFKLEKVDDKLYKALTNGPQVKFESDIHDLATTHFEKANASNHKRKLMLWGAASVTALTGVLTGLAFFGFGRKYEPIANFYAKYTTRNIAIAGAIVLIASAVLTRYLMMRENRLKNQLQSAHKPVTDAHKITTQKDQDNYKEEHWNVYKFLDLLSQNINAKTSKPTTVDDAVTSYGKGMTKQDQDLLRTVFKQDNKLLQKDRNEIFLAFIALKTLAALKAQGLPSSKSGKTDLLAKIASTGNEAGTNAIIALLKKDERKDIIRQALLQQTDNLDHLMNIIEESDKDLFEQSLKLLLSKIKSSDAHLATHALRYKKLVDKTRKAEKLPEWKDAPEKPKSPFPMDKIIQALNNNPNLSQDKKSEIAEQCGLSINLIKSIKDPSASDFYTFYKDDKKAQVSKASAKIVASWV